ncbi:hypothetical protein BKA70DRAFT_1286412 [Coprinopsis sp. MPI-PUGE-AT-0042]|nr:hypothetical protein BKA70DRAFT_1286412 [Coprinopsis sp. MPI-PUGE-AT-0042]
MSAMDAIDFQVAQTLSLVYTRYALVASMTIIVLEYFELLELEKLLIWPSKWSLTKILFVASRYLPFGFVTLYVYYNSALPSTSPKECHILFGLAAGTLVIAGLCADAVLYLRLYALSKQARLTKVVLLVNFAVVTVLCVMGIALFLRSETYIPSPNLLPLTTCFHRASKMTTLWLTIAYGALLYSSLFTTTLSLWYGIRLYLAMRPMPPSTLIKIFHRDGAVYFFCISTISLANAFLALFAPLQYRYLLSGAQGVVHSVLATRMILHLREIAQDTMVHLTSNSLKPERQDEWGSPSTRHQLSEFKAAERSARMIE